MRSRPALPLTHLLWAQGVVAPLTLLWVPPVHEPLWRAAWLVAAAVQAWWVLQRLRQPTAPAPAAHTGPRALLALGVVLGVQGLMALLAVPPQTSLAVSVGVPPLVLLAVWALAHAQRAAQTQAASALEAAQAAADERIASAAEGARAQWAVEAQQQLDKVIETERKRIAGDLHDDLGAKLLTIVHTSESERIASLAREALEEMRLSVRGLTGRPMHLSDALGDWRREVVSRLAQANILAEWMNPPEEVEITLPARTYVQTTRILREAVSNIIKHSAATHCSVQCDVLSPDALALHGEFVLAIRDNGQGIQPQSQDRVDRGHGMSSMASRARQLNGHCKVLSAPGEGTLIQITIPL